LHHVAEVCEGKDPFGHPFFEAFAFFFVDQSVGFAGHLDDIAHREDTACHAFGAERFEGIEVFACSDEFDGDGGHCLDADQGAAACIAVEFGHDHAVEAQRIVEGLGAVNGVLSGHSVDDQEDLGRLDGSVDLFELLHQFRIDGQSTCGIEDDDIGPRGTGRFEAFSADFDGVRFAGFAENADSDLFAQDVELFDRRGALEVGCDQKRLEFLFFDQDREFSAGGGFS